MRKMEYESFKKNILTDGKGTSKIELIGNLYIKNGGMKNEFYKYR